MELWIRSQDKEVLTRVVDIWKDADKNEIQSKSSFAIKNCLGIYKTKERALEILDEISNKIKNKYIVKANCLIKPSDIMKEKEYFENTYDGDFIMQTPEYEIEPINPNIIYYEMPKE